MFTFSPKAGESIDSETIPDFRFGIGRRRWRALTHFTSMQFRNLLVTPEATNLVGANVHSLGCLDDEDVLPGWNCFALRRRSSL